MNYTQPSLFTQDENIELPKNISSEYLMLPSGLNGFTNTATQTGTSLSMRQVYCFTGKLKEDSYSYICPMCGNKMHIHGNYPTTLRHLPFGSTLSCVSFNKHRYKCTACGHTDMQPVPFKSENHNITKQLLNYVKDLLSNGLTNKLVAELSGLGENTVKAIDLQRLKEQYTVDGKLIKPEKQTKYIGIDEFKLHDGYRYATVIIDMETGHILWLRPGKKKACVYSFIEHVGLEWMDNVEAVACDMNSDFQEAIEERCPHISVVFDHFHIVKNFNDKVVGEIRKEEQRRLLEEGNENAAKSLKHSKYILTASKETLAKKDKESEEGKVLRKGSSLFGTENVSRGFGYLDRYDDLIKQNELLFTCDLIKEKLAEAYKLRDGARMAEEIIEIIDICIATNNKHMLWFARLLDKHFEGIVAHADYAISSGKVEGVNNKIKTLRRQGYGYPDDEYFFLKLFDISRKGYIRNQKSHKLCD